MSDGNEGDPGTLGRKRRSWTLEEKRRIVDESLDAGASLAEVARRHDLNANQLFTWRRQFGVEAAEPKNLAPIVPVTITPDTTPEENEPNVTGQMEIVFAEGDRILVWSDVDSAALTRVLKALARR
jgi:transposase